jgi:hypothetical protein
MLRFHGVPLIEVQIETTTHRFAERRVDAPDLRRIIDLGLE